MAAIAEAVQRLLDSDGDRKAFGNLEEPRESVERLEAYHQFQPERFERRPVNHELRTIHDEVQP